MPAPEPIPDLINTADAETAREAAPGFEPPKYLASLIAAINDGAKSAQAGVLAFTLIGLYLLATALSTTDEDLLLQHTVSISQIGVQVPVVFSFAIAPVVFLFLHVYTLIRYDMLAANLRQFRTDLETVPLEVDRERCRQLLANVEFVQTGTAHPCTADFTGLLHGSCSQDFRLGHSYRCKSARYAIRATPLLKPSRSALRWISYCWDGFSTGTIALLVTPSAIPGYAFCLHALVCR
jgi:hypothetical protein